MPYITCECGKNYHDSKVCCPDCGEMNDWFMSDDAYMDSDDPYGMGDDDSWDNILDND